MKKIISLIMLFCLFITSVFSQCQAGYTYTVSGAALSVTDISTHSTVINYDWNFGDGGTDWTSNPPQHSYQYAGTYSVCLTITDSLPQTCNSTFCKAVTITNAPHPPCNAVFTTILDSIGTNVYFNNNSPYSVQWNWNFGDGNTSTAQSPVHQYSTNATYSVCLTTITTVGDTCSFCDTINSTPCWQKLNTSFTHTQNNTVAFTNNCSGASVPHYNWDFGDGSYSVLLNPTHAYQYNGTYSVCLDYSDSSGGCAKSFCDTLSISNASQYPCNAIFSYSPDSMGNGVYFYDNSSMNIVTWNWSFPGGNPSSSSSQYPGLITYPAGTYTASLNVTNQSGISCSYYSIIKVGSNCNNTKSYFTMSPNASPHVWDAINYSTGNPPISYLWNWGDGSPNSTSAAPNHTYATAGWYNICLSIVDANGCGSSYCAHDTLYKHTANSSMITVQVILATGITENDLSNYFSVYPNPANGEFTIYNSLSGNNYELKITNTLGEVVFQKTVTRKQETVNMNSAGGVYFLHIKTAGGISVKKILKN